MYAENQQKVIPVKFIYISNNLRMKKGKRRSSHPEVFWEKRVLKICSKFTGEHPCRSLICNIIEIALPHGFSPVNLLHIFRTPFPRNIPGRLLLKKKALFHISHIFHKSLSCNFLVFHIESKKKKKSEVTI